MSLQAAAAVDHDADTVSLRGARLAFGDRVLWEDLDLSVSRGEFVAVLGPNGSGKTSLLKVLLGQLPLSAGWGWWTGSRSPRAAGASATCRNTARWSAT